MNEIHCSDAYKLCTNQKRGSIDLILTDPPYNIAVPVRDTDGPSDYPRNRFTLTQDAAPWDSGFKLELALIREFWTILRDGGTAIIFYDIYKLETLRDLLRRVGFRGLRIIYWLRTNPIPQNTSKAYLINSAEVALVAVKGHNATFNADYHKGIFRYPSQNRKSLGVKHPTIKPLKLIEELITIHSNNGDRVFDCFLGSGVSALASLKHGREFIGGDLNEDYVSAARQLIEKFRKKVSRLA